MAGAKEHLFNVFTVTAGEDCSSAMNFAVEVSGGGADNTVAIWDTNTEVPVGVIIAFGNAGASGDILTLAGPGSIVKVKCGGTVTRGLRVKLDTGTQGTIINSVGGSAALFGILGTALETGADGDLVLVQITPSTNYYAS